MGTHSQFWLFSCKLAGIFLMFTGLTGATDCQVFVIDCLCSTVFNDRGVELGTSVDCSSKGLTDIPTLNSSFNKPIYELKLNNNNIRSLGDNILASVNVTKLDLSGNLISSVSNNTFLSLGNNLKILILSGDTTSQPPKNAFVNLHQLEELTLRNYSVPHLANENSYFLSFTKLQHLTVDDWKLISIGPDSFQLASNLFLLLNLTILNQPSMETFPIDALHSRDVVGLQKLHISGTAITKLGYSAFSGLTQVQEIDLTGNVIGTLDSGCFNEVEDTLVTLLLSNNELTEDAGKLSGLTKLVNLQKLDLSSNLMTAVPNLSQLGTNKLLSLFLSNNRITYLTENSLAGIAGTLRLLDLSQNQIRAFPANYFSGATKLEVLSLSAQSGSNNPLQLPPSLVQAAQTLKELHVNGQEINPSNLWATLWQLNKLEVLNLSSTKLTFIPDMELFNLTGLKSLDLSNNRLTPITQAALAGPRNLKKLSLTGTSITTLSSCVFYQYTSVPISLAMGNTPLTCDCAVKWLWNSINNGNVTFIPGQEAVCSDNTLLASKTIEQLCNVPSTEPPCSELYSPLKLSITLQSVTSGGVLVIWQLQDTRDLKSFMITVTNFNSPVPVFQQNFTASTTSYTLTNLVNIEHLVCVNALFFTYPSISTCTHIVPNSVTTERTADTSPDETGIIIGVVVGGVVLLGILAAIGYLICSRRKNKEKGPSNVPVQPRNFSKSELPSMNEETRTFSKPKKPRAAGAPEHRDGMQVVAISDGQTSNLRVGRAQLMSSSGSLRTTGSSKPSSTSSYENDNRQLPEIPATSPSQYVPAGYYNMGYKDDKYDEIGSGKESHL